MPEYLKPLFGEESLTYDQFAEKLSGVTGIKLVNLTAGGYVGKEKYDATAAQLVAANAKLEGYDPEWKSKAAQAQKDAEAKIEQAEFNSALNEALNGAKSRNTTAVKALLNIDALKYSGGKIVGLGEQLEALKKDNGYLFEDETPPPAFGRSATGTGGGGEDAKTQANAALRAAFGGTINN